MSKPNKKKPSGSGKQQRNRGLSMKYKLNDRFSISSDQWNWIQIEGSDTHNPIRRYYANLKQLSSALLDALSKDTLERVSITESKNSPVGSRIDFLMSNITQDLEPFLMKYLTIVVSLSDIIVNSCPYSVQALRNASNKDGLLT